MTVKIAWGHERNSRFVAAKAATQGIYKTVKTKNVKELNGVKMPINAWFKAAVEEDCVKTVKVETTDSFAVIPVIKAVEARQSLKPSGAKIGDTNEPIAAKILCELSVTKSKVKLKLC